MAKISNLSLRDRMMRKIFDPRYQFLMTICLAFLLCPVAHADINKYALLVGISEYHVKPLAGPVNDVRAVRKALTTHWDFDSKNISVLLNRQATKKNILQNIEDLYQKSKSGDEIFIYFSGHGTSASDKNLATPLPTTTGAFIPVDVKDLKNVQELVDHLIIGKKDIRPLLSKFDKDKRFVFVAIDACYSGNTVRGKESARTLPSRFLSLENLLPKNTKTRALQNRGFGDDVSTMSTMDWLKAGRNENNRYPYKHIFYLSASGEHEPAQDIPPNMLDLFPTIDAKPHGAFTDTLLRILNMKLDSDVNGDGTVSYAELKKVLRNSMRKRGFNHTPQGLPSLAEDKTNLSDRKIFGTSRGLGAFRIKKEAEDIKNQNKKSTQPIFSLGSSSKLRIRLDPELSFLSKFINEQSKLSLVEFDEDIVISQTKGNITLLTGTGDIINSTNDIDSTDLVNILLRQQWLKQNLSSQNEDDFFVELENYDSGIGSTYVDGDLVGFSIRSSEDAYLLLVDIDANGLISVIFPFEQNELKKYPGNHITLLKNISKVRAPFGRDVVQLYAFNQLTDDLKRLRGKEFTLGSPLMENFENLINDPELKKAKANLAIFTTPRS